MLKTSKNYRVYEIRLIDIIKEATNTYTYIFTKPNDLVWEEGAHTHLALNHFDEKIGWWEKKHVRHFSICSLADEDTLRMTTRLPELCTDYKHELKSANKGDVFYLFKVGSRLTLRREERPLIFLSAGVGFATIRPLIRKYIQNTQGIDRIISLNVDSSQEYLFFDEMKDYMRHENLFEQKYVPSRQAFYHELERIIKMDKIVEQAVFYVVGGDDFLIQVHHVLSQNNIDLYRMIFDKKEEFLMENFR